jgi:glycosyltransferase involved in cell wall biosynthesis
MPTVSVIVPTFNRAAILKETLDSILAQTFPDFELIVVDNESTDDTEALVRSFNDGRIRYFRHPNGGVVAVNRNFGMRVAHGEYLAFCDDDDQWMKGKLARQLEVFRRDEGLGLVCTNAVNFDGQRERGLRVTRRIRPADLSFEGLSRGSYIVNSSVMVRRKTIEDVGPMDESREIFTGEDFELWLRIARRYRIAFLNEPLVRYRIHPSAHGQIQSTRMKAEIMERVYGKLLEKGYIAPDEHRRMVASLRRATLLKRFLRSTRFDRLIVPLRRITG